MKVWICALVRSQLFKTAVVYDGRLSFVPVTELNMSTHQLRYNGTETENAENS